MEPQTQTLFGSEPNDISRRQDEERTRSGAHWFYWVAALSLVTSIVALMGGRWAFFASLGITRIIDEVAVDGLAPRIGEGVKIVAFILDLLAAGIFALLGYFATKRQTWAFIVGMALYVIDAFLFIAVVLLFGTFSLQAFIVVAFHGYVLWHLFNGYKACARLAAPGGNTPPPPFATPV